MKRMLAVFAFIAYFCSPISAIQPWTLELDSIFLSGNFYFLNLQVGLIRSGEFEMDEMDESLSDLYELMGTNELSIKVEDAKRTTTKKKIIELFGEDSRNAGLAMLQNGEYTQAGYEELKKATAILTENCGEESWECAYAELRMGTCMLMLRQNQEALAHALKAQKLLTTIGYEKHWLYAKALAQGASIKALGKDEGAIDDTNKAIDIVLALGDDGICPAIEVFAHAAFSFSVLGHIKESLDVSEQLAEVMEGLEMKGTMNYIANQQNIAAAYYALDDHKTAKAKFLECKAMYEALGETGSPNYKNLEAWLKELE